MAERRMFSKSLIDSDAFVDMTAEARLLYYDLAMRADDDGFVNSPRKIMRMLGSSQQSLDELIRNGFIIAFDSGVIVITHWKMHNYIPKDRYKPTVYTSELAKLEFKEGVYCLADTLDTTCIQNVSRMDTQDRLGKDRLGKESEDEDRAEKDLPCGSHTHNKKPYGEFENVMLTDEELSKLKSDVTNYERYIEELSNYMARTGKRYKSHYAAIKAWYRRGAQSGAQGRASPDRVHENDYDADILEVLKNA